MNGLVNTCEFYDELELLYFKKVSNNYPLSTFHFAKMIHQ